MYIYIAVYVTYDSHRNQINIYASTDLKNCRKYIRMFKSEGDSEDDNLIKKYPTYEYAQFGEVEKRLNQTRTNHFWIQKFKVS